MIGQVGIAGPVALAPARLHALLGDRVPALSSLAIAEHVAARTGDAPTMLRCRLLTCELTDSQRERGALASGIAADAERMGMRGVAVAANALI